MCERKAGHTVSKRLRISELNPHLLCALCGGYLIDATTIIECLHSFCKTCILRYLETSNYCPICEVLIHKTRPWQNIRLDHSLQNAVYKMVPGLFQSEMKRRREFYDKLNLQDKRGRPSHQPEAELGHRIIFSQEEQFSISIEYSPDGKPVKEIKDTKSKSLKRPKGQSYLDKRYLKCPAAFRIQHLKKFIGAKFSLPPSVEIDLFHETEPLADTFSLMDVAYIYNWKRDCVLRLFYSFYEIPTKLRKVEAVTPVTEKVFKSRLKDTSSKKDSDRNDEKKPKSKKDKSREKRQGKLSGKKHVSAVPANTSSICVSQLSAISSSAVLGQARNLVLTGPALNNQANSSPGDRTEAWSRSYQCPNAPLDVKAELKVEHPSAHTHQPPIRESNSGQSPVLSPTKLKPPPELVGSKLAPFSYRDLDSKNSLKLLIKATELAESQNHQQITDWQNGKSHKTEWLSDIQALKPEVSESKVPIKSNLFEQMDTFVSRPAAPEPAQPQPAQFLAHHNGHKRQADSGPHVIAISNKNLPKTTTSVAVQGNQYKMEVLACYREATSVDSAAFNSASNAEETKPAAFKAEKGVSKTGTSPASKHGPLGVGSNTSQRAENAKQGLRVNQQDKKTISFPQKGDADKSNNPSGRVSSVSPKTNKQEPAKLCSSLNSKTPKNRKGVTGNYLLSNAETRHVTIGALGTANQQSHVKPKTPGVEIKPVTETITSSHLGCMATKHPVRDTKVLTLTVPKGQQHAAQAFAGVPKLQNGAMKRADPSSVESAAPVAKKKPRMQNMAVSVHAPAEADGPICYSLKTDSVTAGTGLVQSENKPVSDHTQFTPASQKTSGAYQKITNTKHPENRSKERITTRCDPPTAKKPLVPAASSPSLLPSPPKLPRTVNGSSSSVSTSSNYSTASVSPTVSVTSNIPGVSKVSQTLTCTMTTSNLVVVSPTSADPASAAPAKPGLSLPAPTTVTSPTLTSPLLASTAASQSSFVLSDTKKLCVSTRFDSQKLAEEDRRTQELHTQPADVLASLNPCAASQAPLPVPLFSRRVAFSASSNSLTAAATTTASGSKSVASSNSTVSLPTSGSNTSAANSTVSVLNSGSYTFAANQTVFGLTSTSSCTSSANSTVSVATLASPYTLAPNSTVSGLTSASSYTSATNTTVSVLTSASSYTSAANSSVSGLTSASSYNTAANSSVSGLNSASSYTTAANSTMSGLTSASPYTIAANSSVSGLTSASSYTSAANSTVSGLTLAPSYTTALNSTVSEPTPASSVTNAASTIVTRPVSITAANKMTGPATAATSVSSVGSSSTISELSTPKSSNTSATTTMVSEPPSSTSSNMSANNTMVSEPYAAKSSNTSATTVTVPSVTTSAITSVVTELATATYSNTLTTTTMVTGPTAATSYTTAAVSSAATSTCHWSASINVANTFLNIPVTEPGESKDRKSPASALTRGSSMVIPKEAIKLDNFLFDTKASEMEESTAADRCSPERLEQAAVLKSSSDKSRSVAPVSAIHHLPKTISHNNCKTYSVSKAVSTASSSSARNNHVIQTTKISTLIPKSNSISSKAGGTYSKSLSYPSILGAVPTTRAFIHAPLVSHVARQDLAMGAINGSSEYDRAMLTKAAALTTSAMPVSQQRTSSASKQNSSKVNEGKTEKNVKSKSVPPLTIPKSYLTGTTLKLQRSPGSTDHYIFAPPTHFSHAAQPGMERAKAKEVKHGSRLPSSPPSAPSKAAVFMGERQRVPTIKISDINRNPIIVDTSGTAPGGNRHHLQYRSYSQGGSRPSSSENGSARAHSRGSSDSNSPTAGSDRSDRSPAGDARRPSDSELLMRQHWHSYTAADLLFNGFKLAAHHQKFHDLQYDTDAMPLDYSQSSSKS